MTPADPLLVPGARLTVHVEAWQQQCCGEDFRVGSTVRWTVQPGGPEPTWIGGLLGPAWGSRVGWHEEHHVPDDRARALVARVRTIWELDYDLEPIPGESRAYQPTPGTGRLTRVISIDPWGPHPRRTRGAPVHHLDGWIVEVTVLP